MVKEDKCQRMQKKLKCDEEGPQICMRIYFSDIFKYADECCEQIIAPKKPRKKCDYMGLREALKTSPCPCGHIKRERMCVSACQCPCKPPAPPEDDCKCKIKYSCKKQKSTEEIKLETENIEFDKPRCKTPPRRYKCH